jgi:hypothetical protein
MPTTVPTRKHSVPTVASTPNTVHDDLQRDEPDREAFQFILVNRLHPCYSPSESTSPALMPAYRRHRTPLGPFLDYPKVVPGIRTSGLSQLAVDHLFFSPIHPTTACFSTRGTEMLGHAFMPDPVLY